MSAYSGSCICHACKRKAYYISKGKYYCGIHSRDDNQRKKMPLTPRYIVINERRELLKNHTEIVEKTRSFNFDAFKTGAVTLQRLLMMQTPVLTTGSILIFPNRRHGKHMYATDDFSSLSPMKMGPIKHGQIGIPDALNLENFHQGSKCFKEEYDTATNNPSGLYYKNRNKFFQDPEPHRHKFEGANKKNKNIPLFFVWKDKNEKEHHLTYIESRQFYCTFYEREAWKNEKYIDLHQMNAVGYNIEICGYDGNPMIDYNSEISIEDQIIQAYLDDKVPFGHERVLATMLLIEPCFYPWKIFTNPAFEF